MSKNPNALANLLDNTRGSCHWGKSSNDHLGATLDIMNLSAQAGPDGDKGNCQWMLYNALIIVQSALLTLGVSGVVFLFDGTKDFDGGFGLGPVLVDAEGIVDPRYKKVLGKNDNFLELLSMMIYKKKYRDGLAKKCLNRGWKRNPKTVYGAGISHGRKAHIFHKKGCNWKTTPPARFGDEVDAEIQRKQRAARK